MARTPKTRKCNDCRYLIKTSYEYDEYECSAGVSEDDKHFIGEGCTYHWNKLRAMKNKLDKAWEKSHTITNEDLKIFFSEQYAENLEEIDLGGMSIIHIITDDFYKLIYGNESEEKFTLRDCYNIVAKSDCKDKSCIIVLVEYPLRGIVYRYGNYGTYWEEIGKLKGYA